MSKRCAALVAVAMVAAAMAGCTAQSSEASQNATSSATADAEAPVPLTQMSDNTALDPGRYVINVAEATSVPLQPVLAVPAGFVRIEGAFGVRADDESRHVWASDVNSVYTHPCGAGAVPEPVLPSAAHLANALFAQPLRTGSAPVPVTVGGYQGFYVDMTVPDDVDVKKCPRGRFELWPGHAQDSRGAST